MPELRQLAGPVVGRRTRLHADEAAGELGEQLENLLAPQLPHENGLPLSVDAMDLEHVLCEINADGANLHVDDPLR